MRLESGRGLELESKKRVRSEQLVRENGRKVRLGRGKVKCHGMESGAVRLGGVKGDWNWKVKGVRLEQWVTENGRKVQLDLREWIKPAD